MVTEAKSAFGVVLNRDGHPVAELNSIGGIEITADIADVTSHQSVAAFREKIATLLDAGSVPMKGNFIASDTLGQIGLLTDQEALLPQDFEIVFPPSVSATFTFSALVKKWAIGDMKIDGSQEFSAELEITGQPTLAITASTGLTTTFLAVSGAGTLIVPAPANAIYNYTVNIGTAISSVTITPTAAAGVITITANGASQVVGTGNPSTAIALGAAGSIVVATIDVKETGKTKKTYTLDLTRATA